jgi:hypothetical protein
MQTHLGGCEEDSVFSVDDFLHVNESIEANIGCDTRTSRSASFHTSPFTGVAVKPIAFNLRAYGSIFSANVRRKSIRYSPGPPPGHLAERSLLPSFSLFDPPAKALETALFFQSQYLRWQRSPNPRE